ncbi:MAG: protein arginine kinase [Bacillota bacterium]|nr:protein arginine kinase [Bacillota bacterium]
MLDDKESYGPDSDVVVSSRIRLARNFSKYPFPFRMSKEQGLKVLDEARESILNNEKLSNEKFLFVDVNQLDSISKHVLVEKHLISPDLEESQKDSGVIISQDGIISIMINEEDHLRLQCIFKGMNIDKAWNKCNELDNIIGEKVDFAYSNDYGYLTCCPTNVGTGIRASAMLHLPALTMTGYIRSILEACTKLNVAVRGLYGENSEASGNMFQISNQVTLGQSEEEIVSHITRIIDQIIEQERVLRLELHKQNPYKFEDRVCRSFGLLCTARIVSAEEAVKLLSDVRLGANLGIIDDIDVNKVDELMVLIQPANLQKISGSLLNPYERDIKRAELIRKTLKG